MTDVTVKKPKSLQQHLKKSADKDLYAHVTKVMSHIVKHCPHKAMEDLEEISYLIKNEGKGKCLNKDEYLLTNISKGYAAPADATFAEGTNKVIDATQPMFKVSKLYFDVI